MNLLTHKTLRGRFHHIARKFSPSASVIKFSTLLAEKCEQLCLQLDPLPVFAEWSTSRAPTLKEVKCLHTLLIRSSILQSDIFSANSLMSWYCKVDAIGHAAKLFDAIPHTNNISWNIMISGYSQCFMFGDSWKYFCQMQSMGFVPDQYTYGSILMSCSALGSILYAELVHSTSIRNGCYSNGYVRSGLIDIYGKLCRTDYALRVFFDCPDDENVVCWNSVIAAAVKGGDYCAGLRVFSQMRNGSVHPNNFTFSSVLTACAALEKIDFGRMVHGISIKYGVRNDVFVGTNLIDLYAKHGLMDEAVRELWRMPSRNVVSWTAVIGGFVQKDDSISALHFFREMTRLGEEVNEYTITSIAIACSKLAELKLADQIHSWILKAGFYPISTVKAALITMYSRIGEVDLSKKLFWGVENVAGIDLWGVIISALAQNLKSDCAASYFHEMLSKGVKPDKFTVSSFLSIIDSIGVGSQVHSFILKIGLVLNVSVGSSLSTMYSKCGSLEESYLAFEEIPEKDVVSWGSMISGFSEHGCPEKSILVFKDMLCSGVKPDQTTLVGVLVAFSDLGNLLKGKEIHSYAIRSEIGSETHVGGALVNMYSKCGALELARSTFDMITRKDQILWCAMVSGYIQKGRKGDAFKLFLDMLRSKTPVDSYTLSSVTGAMSLEEGGGFGSQLHSLIMKLRLYSEVSVGSSLITMYSNFGEIENCYKVFTQIENPDLVGWTTMIMSYAQHGKGKEAITLYERMKRESVTPDSVTFVAVLLACSHAGLVEEGYVHLRSMVEDYGIEPALRHYACMVDLLGRAGRLSEAETFIDEMPIQPDGLIWSTLLAACRVHGDVDIGSRVAKRIMNLQPSDPGAYTLLSNIQAEMGKWNDVLEVRNLMKGSVISKEPGWSYS